MQINAASNSASGVVSQESKMHLGNNKQPSAAVNTPIPTPIAAHAVPKTVETEALDRKVLASDKVVISKQSQEKLLAEMKEQQLVESEEKRLAEAKEKQKASEKEQAVEGDESEAAEVKTTDKAEETEEAGESELDQAISELEMKILEVSVEIELLKVKGDDDSLKEAEKLEVDLAMLRGKLEAKLKMKLDMAKNAVV
jgi:hypothetical protein